MILFALGLVLPTVCQASPALQQPSELQSLEAPLYVPMYGADGIRERAMLGAWDLLGYGFVILFEERDMRVFSTSSAGSWEVTGTDFLTTDSLFVASNDEGERRRISYHALDSPLTLERLPGLPADCGLELEWTPTRLFDAFAATMGDYYPFFEVRKHDWPGRVLAARKLVNDGMSELELWRAMQSTLLGLGDGHVSFSADIDGIAHSVDSGPSRVTRQLMERLPAKLSQAQRARRASLAINRAVRSALLAVKLELLGGRSRTTAGQFVWGIIEDEIGYISIADMGFNGELDSGGQVRLLHEAFDEILAELGDSRAIILDCSRNGGGLDVVSHAIASQFIDETRRPYSEGPGKHPDVQHPITIKPWSGERFTGPVYLISSCFTVSAAEVFQLCLKDEQHVTLLGRRGANIFSDIIPKMLPNGWELGMSIEVYRDAEGVCYEGFGVPLDQEFALFRGLDPSTSFYDAMLLILDLVWSEI